MSDLSLILPKGSEDQAINLKAFTALMRGVAGGDRWLERHSTDTYEEFVALLYVDLDEVIGDLEDRKKYFSSASEDQISDAIISDLKRFGYAASHDTDRNGHVDITVECKHKPGFLWLGEAKLDNGPKYCFGGVEQLTTRYSTARRNANHGGLLLYNRDYDNANGRLSRWAEYLTENHAIACSMEDKGRPGLSFSTAEAHKGTGLPYYVRHMMIHLKHSPDK